MNFYKIQGQLTRWTSFKLKEIGFKNILRFSMSNNSFLIETKDKSQYEITIKKIK